MIFEEENFKELTKEEKDRVRRMEEIEPTSLEKKIILEALSTKVKFRSNITINNITTLGNKLGSKLGNYISHYVDGYTLVQFFTSIINHRNYKEKSTVENIFKKIYFEANQLFKKYNLKIKRERVKVLVDYFTIYNKYMGLKFEYGIKVILKLQDFKVLRTSQEEDMEYKLDIICISPKGNTIGIQCKSSSFINSIEGKKKYFNKNINGQLQALDKGICNKVFYIFHNSNGELESVDVREKDFGATINKALIELNEMLNSNKIKKSDITEGAMEKLILNLKTL